MRAAGSRWMRGAAAALALAASTVPPARAQPAPVRVALVIGEGAYRAGPLPAAPNDAGLVAQVLAGAGFEVTGARDLDGDGLRRAFRDFLDRAGAAGPDGIAILYFAGRAVQADGDDYLVPVDAKLARPADVPIEAMRLADVTRALAALPIQARVVVVDGAYGGGPGAPGLALMEAEQGELLAFNAAPGTAAPTAAGPYGPYAQALASAMKQGGVPVSEVFDRVRLAVDQATGGAVVPWDSDRLTRSFTLFDRAPNAPAMASAGVPFAALSRRPLRDFPPAEAFDVALARDTLPAYVEFLAAFPDDPLARRVRRIAAVRREALFWRATLGGNSPDAYWTYLLRYPRGPHAGDARRRLARLAAAANPPPRFVPVAFDVPPPGPEDLPYDGPIVFVGPDLPPPPPPPVYLLPPLAEAPPPRSAPPPGPVLLPIPVPVPIPYVRPPLDPGAIAAPRGAPGGYPHPRPYARGANGDGLVVQSAPEPASQPAALPPRPATPAPSPGPSAPNVPPPVPAPPRPPAPLPAPPPPRPSAPAQPHQPAAPLPTPPAAPSPVAPPAPVKPAPPQPSPPRQVGPPPAPAHPPAAAPHPPAPVPPIVVPPAPLPAPAAAPPLPAHPPGPPAGSHPAAPNRQPVLPAPDAAPPLKPPAAGRHLDHPAPAPAAPAPSPAAPEEARPAPPAGRPPARPGPASPAPARPEPPAAPQKAEPAPKPPAAAQPRPAPAEGHPPRPAPIPGGPAPERPHPDHPAAGPGPGHPPGEHRPGCGHPGGPPCPP